MLLVAFREDLFRHEEYQNNKIFQVFSGDNAYIFLIWQGLMNIILNTSIINF